MKPCIALAAASMCLGFLSAAPTAQAGAFLQSGSGACRGAKWTDEQKLTRTAYGISNKTAGAASIVCSVPIVADQIPPNSMYEVTKVVLRVLNHSSVSAKMTCTFTAPGDINISPVKTTTSVPAFGGAEITANFGMDRLAQSTFAAACNFPANFQLLTVGGSYIEFEFVEIQ